MQSAGYNNDQIDNFFDSYNNQWWESKDTGDTNLLSLTYGQDDTNSDNYQSAHSKSNRFNNNSDDLFNWCLNNTLEKQVIKCLILYNNIL